MIDLSVLIVTYNSRRDIGACVRSLKPALAGISGEIVVIDNHSVDGTADVVRAEFPDVELVELPENRGFAGGIQRGLAASSGRYALWVNPDATYATGRIADVL